MTPANLELLEGRKFQLWEYRVSHSSLLIRSSALPGLLSNIDIAFHAVDYLELPAYLGEVRLESPSAAERGRLERIVNEKIGPQAATVLVAGTKRFPVVAPSPLSVESNELSPFSPRFDFAIGNSWDSNWPRWLHGANPRWMESYLLRAKPLKRIERSSLGNSQDWGYSSDRQFALWNYSEASGRILLRSPQADHQPTNIDIACLGVKYLEMPSHLDGLRILQTPPIELRRLEKTLESELLPSEILTIEASGRRFSIVADSMFIEENMLRFDESPFWKPPAPLR